MTDQQEVMVLGFGLHVFEDTLLPVSLHEIPVINSSVSDWILYRVGFGVGNCLIPNEEV